MDKIVEGKVKAFYDMNCLVCQKYIRDDSLSITDLLNKRAKEAGAPLVLSNFVRWTVGQQ